MSLALFSGSANVPLAEHVSRELGVPLGRRISDRFPDGEFHVEVQDSVRGRDVYLIQPTSPPSEAHLLELFLLADACRRAGAGRLTAVIPYFGYARQDRRRVGREPVGARVVADLIQAANVQRVVAVDLHTASNEGLFSIPVQHLTAVPLIADRARAAIGPASLIVAPDLGGVKRAEVYAKLLNLPVAIVHKTRISGVEVRVRQVVGDPRDRIPVIVDDMLTTGGTVKAAVEALVEAGARPEAIVLATHGLFVGPAEETLRVLPIRRIFTTDSVANAARQALPIDVSSLGPLIAEAIRRLHQDHSLGDLIAHG